jgi:spore coat protein U-like protein
MSLPMRAKIVFAAIVLLLPVPAHALCTSFGVSASVLDFGVYDPGAAADTASTGSVSVQCGIGVLPAFAVSLSKGSGSYAQRTMVNGANLLNYNLYADSGHMTVWGDGTNGTVTQSLTGIIALGATTYTVYGLVGGGQRPAPGGYSDTITVTVTF